MQRLPLPSWGREETLHDVAPFSTSPGATSFAIQDPVAIDAYKFIDRPHEDVFLIGSHYLAELDQIVVEAEQKFPNV